MFYPWNTFPPATEFHHLMTNTLYIFMSNFFHFRGQDTKLDDYLIEGEIVPESHMKVLD